MRAWLLLPLLAAAMLLAAAERSVFAAEGPLARASDAQARAALTTFSRAIRSKDPAVRAEAVEALGAVRHKSIAGRLAKVAGSTMEAAVRQRAFKMVGLQVPADRGTVRKLAMLIAAESEVRRKARLKAMPDYPTNRFGDSLLGTPKGKVWRAAARAEAAVWVEALRSLERLGPMPSGGGLTVREYLDDADDDLVAFSIGLLGRWRAWTALPALLELLSRYPTEASWSSVGVGVNRGGHAAARTIWHARYGHPDKRRPRPALTRALLVSLHAITGESLSTPAALASLLTRPDVARKIRGR